MEQASPQSTLQAEVLKLLQKQPLYDDRHAQKSLNEAGGRGDYASLNPVLYAFVAN